MSELRYSKDHEWVKVEGDIAIIGITKHAEEALGEVVYVEFPEVGDTLEADGVFGVIESVKAAADSYTPVSGEVVEINERLEDEPNFINEEPYEAWILKVKMSDIAELDRLMDEGEYRKYCEEE